VACTDEDALACFSMHTLQHVNINVAVSSQISKLWYLSAVLSNPEDQSNLFPTTRSLLH